MNTRIRPSSSPRCLRGLGLGDPGRLKSYVVRFMNVVYPEDTLITEGWKLAPGRFIIRTTNQAGKTVLGNGLVEVAG